MNKNTAYLVLSIRDIETLLAAANASAKAAGGTKSHCIILRNLQLNADKGGNEWRISSYDVLTRAEAVHAKANTKRLADDLAVWNTCMNKSTVCMNDSDAAI